MEGEHDVIVIGGGPAGLSSAIGLGRLGRKVLVIDRMEKPQDKACGEGVMPDGLQLLENLGVPPGAAEGAPLRGICYHHKNHSVELDWHASCAWGIRRTRLSELLRAQATAVGVSFLVGQVNAVQDGKDNALVSLGDATLSASLVVGADGLHSRARRALGGSQTNGHQLRRFGLRQHFNVAPWSERVEVHLCADAEAYVTPVGPQEVGVAILTSAPMAGKHLPLASFPLLQSRLQGAKSSSRLRGAGPLAQTVSQLAGHRIVLVGDAGGYIDAITGEGITLALGEAALLCGLIERGLPLYLYQGLHKQLTARYTISVKALLWLGEHTWMRAWAFNVARWMPQLASAIANWATQLPDIQNLLEGCEKKYRESPARPNNWSKKN